MIFIQLHHALERCVMPDGKKILMVIAHEVDSNGNWIPSETRAFDKAEEVYREVRRLRATREPIFIRGSADFMGMAQEMGLRLRHAEWEVV